MNEFGLKRLLLRVITFLPMASAIDVFLNYTGDLMLGALVPVHQRAGPNSPGCGRIQLEYGVQTLEAMLYTVERINEEGTLLPGIKLGLLVYDSCDNPTHALEQSLDIVKGFIGHLSMWHNDSDFSCTGGGKPVFRGGTDHVVAVIGGLSSTVTIQLATLLHLFKVPQVSYMSTSATLSDKALYPFFFRTVPSDVYQAHAILEFLRQMNWTYVGVVYSDTDYGRHGWDMLTTLAANYSVCFATPAHRLRAGNQNDAAVAYNIIQNNTDLRVVILFSERSPEVEDIIERALNDNVVAARLTWVIPDAWADGMFEQATVTSPRRLLAGSVAILPLDRLLSGFDDHFLSLRLDHQKINPWFAEFWKAYFGCTSINSTTDECVDVGKRVADVRGDQPLRQARYLHFVRDAIWAVAKALDDMHTAYCGKGVPGLCPAMRHVKGMDLRERLTQVQFKDESGQNFRFEDGRDGPPRYSVMQYQLVDGHYDWVKTGNYTLDASGNQPRLILDKEIQKRFTSSCTPTCQQSHIKVRWREGCCWVCRPCAEFQYVVDEWTCEECPMGYKSSPDKTKCVLAPEQEISFKHPWAIVAMTIASLGVVSTLLVSAVFWCHRHTPVVKALGREVSALLLLAELLSFLVTFVMVAPPTDGLCGLTRFALGFCFTLSYAAVFTKTNRIARIFNQTPGLGPGKTRFTSPRSQLVITGLLTCVEVVINGTWLALRPPTVTYVTSGGERHRICSGLDNESYFVGLAYPLLLVGLCMVYAVKTRKCPGGFNETRHIAFTTYTVFVIWLAFVPLYLASTSTALRTVTLAISLSLSGLVQLGCLFFPKVYTVLLKPEKNTKEGVMMPQRFAGPLIKQRPISGAPCETDGLSKNEDSNIHKNGSVSVPIPSQTPASTRSTSPLHKPNENLFKERITVIQKDTV